jgi:hypothetical protein
MEYTARQQRLIEQHRDCNLDHDWWDNTYADFKEVACAFGVRLDLDQIHFSGFWSQGDGASFATHNFTLADILDAGQKTLSANTYGDDPAKFVSYVDEFHSLYELVRNKLGPIAALHPDGRQVAEAWGRCINRRGHMYSHSNTMRIDSSSFDAFTVLDEEAAERCGIELDEAFEDALLGQLRACADALYKTLEEEHDYQTDDEQVWDMIVANGWDKGDDEEDDDGSN